MAIDNKFRGQGRFKKSTYVCTDSGTQGRNFGALGKECHKWGNKIIVQGKKIQSQLFFRYIAQI